MISATIFEAKTNLSALVKKAQKGQTVIITSGRAKLPVAKLSALEPVSKRRLGSMEIHGYVPDDSIFDSLPEEDLRLWNGEGE